MDKLKMYSPDTTQQNIEKIQALFPNCVTESKGADGELKLAIDFDQLKQELSNSIVEGPQERYQLNWPGKREALLTANAPIAKTLRPCREESVNFDTTENLFIEGDNLDALKMLQETYLGKVKMIYIDPPYNTGNDFIYSDNFSEGVDDFLKRSSQIDEYGNRLFANSESNGRFHSDWLTMIYPRLKLSRKLLSDSGFIVVSIDESEYSNLLKVMDEIYGNDSQIATFVWKTRQASGKQVAASNVSFEHEYLVMYGKSSNASLKGIPRDPSSYKNPDNDPRGPWAKHPLDVGSTREERPNCFYNLVDPDTGITYEANPNRVWAFSPSTMQKLINENKILFDKNGKSKPGLKKFFNELKTSFKPISTWLQKDTFCIGYNTEGTKVANSLFNNEKLFDYPKPVSLIKILLSQTTHDNDIVVDFFAGSGTTAHAVFEYCALEGVNLKNIMIQLGQETSKSSSAYKAGYKTIAELCKERIRRAGEKTLAGDCHKDWNKDVGFRVLKVDTSNMADVYYSPDQVSQGSLDLLVDNIKSGRTDEDLLFQVLLDWGVDLTLPIRKETIQGKSVFFVDDDALVACFDLRINEALIKELATKEPLRVVFRDDGFESDAVKINAEQIFKQVLPHTEVKAI